MGGKFTHNSIQMGFFQIYMGTSHHYIHAYFNIYYVTWLGALHSNIDDMIFKYKNNNELKLFQE